jgi:hypothetical protein
MRSIVGTVVTAPALEGSLGGQVFGRVGLWRVSTASIILAYAFTRGDRSRVSDRFASALLARDGGKQSVP